MTMVITDYFSEQEISHLTAEASRAEGLGELTTSSLEIIREKNLLNLFVPQQYGGMQLDLPEALPWLEAVSWIDGSLGWTLTLASGAGLFGAYMHPDFARSVFNQKNTLIAGSGFPGGKAEKTSSGYLFDGSWKYASGIDHATLITATCYITENGHIKYEDETPVTKAVACYPDEVTITKSWNSYGLKATGSHDFEIQEVELSQNRLFTISPNSVHVNELLYHYPFEAFAHATLAVSMLGIARRFLDEANEILLSKNDVPEINGLPKSLRNRIKGINQKFRKAKEALYGMVNTSWQELQKAGILDDDRAKMVSAQARQSCQTALRCAQQCYPLLGMAVINPDSTVNRCWRDLHTASQHMFLRPQT